MAEIVAQHFPAGRDASARSRLRVTVGSVQDKIRPPYTSVTLDVVGPPSIAVDDWIAITQDTRLVALVSVQSITEKDTSGPSATRAVTTLGCEGWFDVGFRNDVISIPGARLETTGTLFDFGTWYEQVFAPYIKTFVNGDLGPALQSMATALLRYRVSEALSPGWSGSVGDAVRVAHDDNSARNAGAVEFVTDPVQGFNVNGVRSMVSTQSKQAELLRTTFVPTDAMVRLYPTLEPADRGRASYPTVLGHNLVLNYGLNPWRTRSLFESLAQAPNNASSPAPTLQTPANGSFDPQLFSKVTWDAKRAKRVDAVFNTQLNLNASDRANAFSCWMDILGPQELASFEALGMPYNLGAPDIERYGLRAMFASWPFMPSMRDPAGPQGDVLKFLQHIAAQLMQFWAGVEKLRSGSFDTGLRLDIRCGDLVSFPHRGRTHVAYVEGVLHRWEGDNNGTRGTTTVTVTRASADESLRDVTISVPGLQAPSQPTAKFTPKTTPSKGGGKTTGIVIDGIARPINYPTDKLLIFGDTVPGGQEVQKLAAANDRIPTPRASTQQYVDRVNQAMLGTVYAGKYGISRRAPDKLKLAVLHSPGGGIWRADPTWGTYKSKVSSYASWAEGFARGEVGEDQFPTNTAWDHFIIDLVGNIWQMQDVVLYAPHTESFRYDTPAARSVSRDLVNHFSVGITLCVGSEKNDFKRVPALRTATPGNPALPIVGPTDWPEGDVVSWFMGARFGQQAQLTRPQYEALGALVGCLARHTGITASWPYQAGPEFFWTGPPASGAQQTFTEADLLPGLYIHPQFAPDRRSDHFAIHRARVLGFVK